MTKGRLLSKDHQDLYLQFKFAYAQELKFDPNNRITQISTFASLFSCL